MAAPSLWFTRSSGWRSRLSKSNPDHLGIAAFGCGPRPRYVVEEERRRLGARLRSDGQVDEFELQLCDSLKQPFWSLLSARLFTHRGEQATLTTVNVINERKRIEQELARERAMLKATLENMDQAMLITDHDLRVIGWNHRCADLLDLSAEFLEQGPTLAEIAEYLLSLIHI